MTQEIPLSELDLAAYIQKGDTLLWGQSVAEPLALTKRLMEHRHAISKAIGGRFRVFLGATYSGTANPDYADCIDFCAYPGAGTNRSLVKAGLLEIYPLHYSHLTAAIATRSLKIDVLFLQLAPVDEQGRYSLSMAHEYLIPALKTARVIIAEVNEQAPWTHGEGMLRREDIDVLVPVSYPPLDMPAGRAGELELKVAQNVAGLVEDGSVLQFGIGALPEAILAQLADLRDLGVHSGAVGDNMARLMASGAINNAKKTIDPGVSIAGVMFGGKVLRDFCHRNPAVQFRSSAYTHGADVLPRIDKFVSLNAAIEVDLTGQINAEVAGGTYLGSVGGAVDFVRAAHRSKGGMPIAALSSVVGSGERMATRIVAKLSGPVSTPRSDAGLIVTEHGVADLRFQSIPERARRLIAIAHPKFREELERASRNILNA